MSSIEAAFGATEVPLAETVLAERYRDAMDPGELLAAFRGKHWRDLGRRDLFLHRESLSALSTRGFRAYVAAYLLASLEGEEAPTSWSTCCSASTRCRPKRAKRARPASD